MGELQRFQAPALRALESSTVESVIIKGNLKELRPEERVAYYGALCNSLGLNPLTRPFEYLEFQGRVQLYALRSCTEQLRQIHNVSVTIVARECVEGCYVVTARASLPNNRQDESIGAVGIDNLKGEARSNAMMKAETKAKRRVTLSICGLAYLDQEEIDSVRGSSHVPVNHETGEIAEPTPAPTLHEDIEQNPTRDTKVAKSSTPFNALKAFSDLKKRFQKIGQEVAYYAVLKNWGVEKSNQFPATQEGINKARGCYKELSLAVQELELPPQVEVFPDPVVKVAGAKVRYGGAVYEVVDSEDGHRWQEVK
jgi:hypothetical protein